MCREECALNTKVIREHKTAATTAGILYIIGTVAGVLSMVLSVPVRDAGDPFAAAAEHSDAVVTVALLVLVMGLRSRSSPWCSSRCCAGLTKCWRPVT